MHIKKNILFIISIIFLLALFGCNQRPSPQEVAQFMLDIKNCNFDAVEKTIKKNKEILNIGFEGMYPIYMAIRTNNIDMVNLIAKPNNVNILLNLSTVIWSPLSIALEKNCNASIIQILIETGADVSFVDELQGRNIFHDFCASRNKYVWEIIKEYATPEILNKEMVQKGATPLSCLISAQLEEDNINDPDVIYLLKSFIEHGGNPNYLIYNKDYAFEVVNFLNSYEVFEYKQVLLDGMKNSPPIEDSEILIEMLEGKDKE